MSCFHVDLIMRGTRLSQVQKITHAGSGGIRRPSKCDIFYFCLY